MLTAYGTLPAADARYTRVYSKAKTCPTLEEAHEVAIQLGKLWVDKNG